MSYQHGKPSRKVKGMRGVEAVIVPCGDGQVHVYTMHEGMRPFGRSAPKTEEAAKLHCSEVMGIMPEDWVTIAGDPPWLQRLADAVGQTIARVRGEDVPFPEPVVEELAGEPAMPEDPSRVTIAADAEGIHFLRNPNRDILIEWDEIESIHVTRVSGTTDEGFLEVYVDHVSGVDFRFHSVERGYAQVMAEMERRLPGFSRVKAEAADDEEVTLWQRS